MFLKQIARSRHRLLLAAGVFVCLLPVLATCEEKLPGCHLPKLNLSDLETIGTHKVPSFDYLSGAAKPREGCGGDAQTKAIMQQVKSLDPAAKVFVAKMVKLIASGQVKQNDGKHTTGRTPKRMGAFRNKKRTQGGETEGALKPSMVREFEVEKTAKLVCDKTKRVVALPGSYAQFVTTKSIELKTNVKMIFCEL